MPDGGRPKHDGDPRHGPEGLRGQARRTAAMACSRACSALTVSWWACTAVMSGATTISHSARIWWPIQRSRTCPASSTPEVARRCSRPAGERGVHGVHEPPVDLAGSLPQDGQDRHADQQPDHRVGPVPAQRYPARTQQHRQRRQPVRPGMQPVRDQRRRADLPPGANAVARRQLIVREPGQRGGHRDQVRYVTRADQPGDGRVGGQGRGRGDGEHDHDPGQVLPRPYP